MLDAAIVEKVAENLPYPVPELNAFRVDGIEVDYLPAPDLERIAGQLIGECSTFSHLCEMTIVYLWKREGGKHHDHPKLGQCQKASGLVKHFSDAEWVIWLAADHARDHILTNKQVEACVFHELLHAGCEDFKPKLAGHDAEMFSAEIARYGAWKMDLRMVERAFEQLRLLGE